MNVKEFEGIFYRVGKWRGHDNYECMQCTFATLGGPEKVLAHVRKKHFSWSERCEPMVAIADRRGREITPEPVDSGMEEMAAEAVTRSEVINTFGEEVGAMLISAGYSTLTSVEPLTVDDLMKIEGIGRTRAKKILKVMSE